MQNIMLVKHHPSVQLAHLYEHLYCSKLKELFASHGLYKFLDYALGGSTFRKRGLIEIDIDIYTPEAKKLIDQLSAQKIDLSHAAVSTALMQIHAELEKPLRIEDPDKLLQVLAALDDTPWTTVDEFDFFDSLEYPVESPPIYADEHRGLPARSIRTKLLLDADFASAHRTLLPLYWQITKIIALANENQLIQRGYYGADLFFESSERATYRKQILRVAHGNDGKVSPDSIASTYLDAIQQLLHDGGFARFCREQHIIDYLNASWLAPNANDMMSDTGVYIGTKGWQQIATEENILALLSHSTVETRFGREKATRAVAEVL